MRPARDCARAALFPIRNPQSNIRNDPMRCNIDTKGKLARLIWGLALGGTALKLRRMDAPPWLSTGCYVAMGWVALLAAPALFAAVPARGLAWVLAGGVVYSIGAVVFTLERPRLRPNVFGAHALWHVLVIAGSACHVWAVARYLTPLQ